MFCGYLCFLVSFPVCGFYSIYSVWTCSIISVCYDTFIAIHTAKLRQHVYVLFKHFIKLIFLSGCYKYLVVASPSAVFYTQNHTTTHYLHPLTSCKAMIIIIML